VSKTYHITAAIPYVNARPHLGHVLEWFQADSLARYYRLLAAEHGDNPTDAVSFTCGTDENSLKNVQAAEKVGQPIQEWLDQYAYIFRQTFKDLDISLTGFGRGSDQEYHWPGVQELWRRCVANGDIYKKRYQGLYCVGCESFYAPEELVDGKCPEHLVEPELV
jgi:methionyl-tRNA synthetase